MMTIQILYTTKCGAGIIRSLPEDRQIVCHAVEQLRKRGIEATIRKNGSEIGQVWKLDGRWNYCFDLDAAPDHAA